jgi:hypothetical protein
MRRLRKFLFIAWLVDSAGLVWLFGYMLLYGSNSDLVTLAGNLGAIWGAIGAWLGGSMLNAKWKARKKNTATPA